MLSNKAATIEQHQEIVGSRFQLAQIIMKRTNQLLRGAPIKSIDVARVGSEFNPKQRDEIPPHRYPKIALEELRQGKITWKRIEKTETPLVEDNQIVFGE